MRLFHGFRKGMKDFGEGIASIVNTALLLVVYIFGVGITSVIARIIGKRFLQTELKKKSYWQDLNLKKRPTETYYRQF